MKSDTKVKRFWKSIANELKLIFGVTASIASLVLLVCVLLPLCFILAFTVPIWILPASMKFWIWIVIVDLPLIYRVILKIRHEESLAKIMTEAYETSGKPMEQSIQEYKDILEKEKENK